MLDCLFNVAEQTFPEKSLTSLSLVSSGCILEHANAITEIPGVLAPPLSQCVAF